MYRNKLSLTFAFFLTLTPIVSFSAFSSDKYVTDDISVYVRRGPGTQFGLVGSLKPGDKVTELETSADGKYTRIKDERNRTSWIESDLLTNTKSLKEQLPALQQEVATLKEKELNATESKQTLITEYTQQLESAKQKIAELEKTNSALQNQADEQLAEIESMSDKLDQNKQSLMLSWFTRGGIVAGIGLIIGLILPLIMPSRRKKDRWMN